MTTPAPHLSPPHLSPDDILTPKLWTMLRAGYDWRQFGQDALAGLTVAIVALPLAMAIAIASGTTPDKGIITAVIAGFLISFLGGSKHQIGGPTAAFVVVVAGVINQHGYDGLLLATLMAGIMLVVLGWLRFGSVMKYIPYPVITGFTAGIAVVIFTTQIKDFMGLNIPPGGSGDFLDRVDGIISFIHTIHLPALLIGGATLAIILLLRRFRPHWPNFLIAVGVASLLVALWVDGNVATIASRFGALPNELPAPSLPDWSWQQVKTLLPAAFTIAFLAGVESLLSAVIADGMGGGRHRANAELVAQGVANIASPLFGGLPATGAIARTATNIRAGAKSPLAGCLHAIFLLAFMFFLSPIAGYFPLSSLAAILMVVAWNMAEIHKFRRLLRAPLGDRLVLLATFLLTVFADLTLAVQFGIALAVLVFLRRQILAVEIDATNRPHPDIELPKDVALFRINGPFFFGAAWRLRAVWEKLAAPPRLVILDMQAVPFIDATGIDALEELQQSANKHGAALALIHLNARSQNILAEMAPDLLALDKGTMLGALDSTK